MGKQLAGTKAEYAGDTAMHDQTRKLGMVYSDPVIDTDLFNQTAAKYGVKFAPGAIINYPAERRLPSAIRPSPRSRRRSRSPSSSRPASPPCCSSPTRG